LLSFNRNANGPQNVTLLNLNTSVFDRIGFITLTSMGVSSMKAFRVKADIHRTAYCTGITNIMIDGLSCVS